MHSPFIDPSRDFTFNKLFFYSWSYFHVFKGAYKLLMQKRLQSNAVEFHGDLYQKFNVG